MLPNITKYRFCGLTAGSIAGLTAKRAGAAPRAGLWEVAYSFSPPKGGENKVF
jgi:hypothetical protein